MSRSSTWLYEYPISLIPIHIENSVLGVCHGVDGGLLANLFRKVLTSFVNDMPWPGVTSFASMVAPPQAKL